MRERVVSIGQTQPLAGILCEPNGPAQTAVILLNSGVIHRVGSCRLSVTLARAFCQQLNLPSLRFDFSGVGESEPRRSSLTAAEVAREEVIEAMNYLADTKNIQHFILYGLCSGAYASYRTALKDPRVIAIAQIDGYCYMSRKSYLHHYLPRIVSVSRWLSLCMRALGLKKTKSGAAVSGIEAKFFEVPNFGNFPPQAEVTQGLQQLVARGVHLFNVFCRSEHYNYPQQFVDCFSTVPFGQQLELLYLANASHILAEPKEQQQVVTQMLAWAKRVMAAKP
jgi:pimeloyl-ACP methyl ester carboxylesterase